MNWLMALEEPPTWEARGNGQWMTNLVASFRSMIRRDRNHPSIIIWGACINHHAADQQLVQAAIEEDPTRDRGMDTVLTPMNFIPSSIYGSGALAIEHTGHTFPAPRGSRQGTFHVNSFGKDNIYNPANREYEQVRRQWEQVNTAYLNKSNAGLAVWCMYDYNTFHDVNEPEMVWHGVCDLFRIPKFSYWWHMSELTSQPMAYVVRIDDTHAVVFSNCEKVRLWAGNGRRYQEVATQSPDTDFITSRTNRIAYALHHPPFHFTVPTEATALKAEGLIGGTVKATNEWKKSGVATALA